MTRTLKIEITVSDDQATDLANEIITMRQTIEPDFTEEDKGKKSILLGMLNQIMEMYGAKRSVLQ